jgi:hypothetical protein
MKELIFEKDVEIEMEILEALEEFIEFVVEINEIDEINNLLYEKHYKLWNKLSYLCTYKIKGD